MAEIIVQKFCRACGVDKPINSFYPNKKSKDGHAGRCGKCYRLKTPLLPLPKPDTIKCIHCFTSLPYTSEFFAPNKRCKFGLRHVCRTCIQTQFKPRDAARRLRNRIAVLTHYSNGTPQCACCKLRQLEFLALDHINGGGRQHRKQLKTASIYVYLVARNFPTGYRVLCHNCNMSLGIYGYCPHVTASLSPANFPCETTSVFESSPKLAAQPPPHSAPSLDTSP